MFLHFRFVCTQVQQYILYILYWTENKCCCVDFLSTGLYVFVCLLIPTQAKDMISTLASFCYQKAVQKFFDANAIFLLPEVNFNLEENTLEYFSVSSLPYYYFRLNSLLFLTRGTEIINLLWPIAPKVLFQNPHVGSANFPVSIENYKEYF